MHHFLTSIVRRIVSVTAVAASLGLVQPVLQAQNASTGSINGTVTDATGAVVPGASVTVTDASTGTVLKLTTNAEGRFTASFLKPDMVQVSAASPGLQSVSTSVQILTGKESAV